MTNLSKTTLGMIGLGRMGANMARRLMKAGHTIVAYDLNQKAVEELGKEGARGAASLEALVRELPKPRNVWVMLPAGEITEKTIDQLAGLLDRGDCVIDGGNSMFKDDVRRAAKLAQKGIEFMDAGTSGGVWGLERGYCMMVGGSPESFARLEPIYAALAPGGSADQTIEQKGYLHCGPVGSGHFTKMIHNGIEYGMMQAFAEGFEILKGSNSKELPEGLRYNLELDRIAELWRHGSVVSSWLLDLVTLGLKEDPALSRYTGYVQDSGEGRWTIQAALEEAVPAHVLSAALFERFRSRQDASFADKLLSAMRHGFGGHVEGGGGKGSPTLKTLNKDGAPTPMATSGDDNLQSQAV